MTATSPVRIAGPASLIAAVPYLLGFEPNDSLVLIGLLDGQVTVAARVDLDDLDEPRRLADLMTVLATKAASTDVVAVTYGDRTEAGTIAATAAASGMRLLEHVRVADGRYWSLTCPIEGCCPAEGTPLVTDNATAAEFVALGVSKAPSREDLASMLAPVPDTDRLQPLVHAGRAGGPRPGARRAQRRPGALGQAGTIRRRPSRGPRVERRRDRAIRRRPERLRDP